MAIIGQEVWLGARVMVVVVVTVVVIGQEVWLGARVMAIIGQEVWLGARVMAIIGQEVWLGAGVMAIIGQEVWLHFLLLLPEGRWQPAMAFTMAIPVHGRVCLLGPEGRAAVHERYDEWTLVSSTWGPCAGQEPSGFSSGLSSLMIVTYRPAAITHQVQVEAIIAQHLLRRRGLRTTAPERWEYTA